MRRLKNGLPAVFSLLAFALLPSAASAQAACHLLGSSTAVPAGFGAAYNLFSLSEETILSVHCGLETAFSVGNGQKSLYIYKTAYEWAESSWRELALSGHERVGDWYVGSAVTNLLRSEAQLDQANVVVAYTCLRKGSTWKCGCRDTSCSQSYWQLQAFYSSTAPGRIINVSSSSQLSSALDSAQPGDHIILANGTYSGFTVSRSGENGNPIVVRSATLLDAKVAGNILINGNDVSVVGMDIINGGRVSIRGTRDRISSSRLRSRGKSIAAEGPARFAIIDHNEIDSQSDGTEVGWFGIVLHYQDGINRYGHHVYRNYLHGAPAKTTGDDNSAIYSNTCSCRKVDDAGVVIEYNLIENWHGDDEVIGTKSGGNIIRYNTLVNGKEFVNRLGDNNSWIGNWIENSKRIRIHGKYNTVIGNVSQNIRIYAGDGDEFGGSVNYVTAVDTILAGNVGDLIVGATIGGRPNHPARNTVVEAHVGSITKGQEVGTSISNSTDLPIPTATKLSPSEVGPFAPTAPKFGNDER